jgi:hypothetical protein
MRKSWKSHGTSRGELVPPRRIAQGGGLSQWADWAWTGAMTARGSVVSSPEKVRILCALFKLNPTAVIAHPLPRNRCRGGYDRFAHKTAQKRLDWRSFGPRLGIPRGGSPLTGKHPAMQYGSHYYLSSYVRQRCLPPGENVANSLANTFELSPFSEVCRASGDDPARRHKPCPHRLERNPGAARLAAPPFSAVSPGGSRRNESAVLRTALFGR